MKCVVETEPPCAKCRHEHRECVFKDRGRRPKHREAPRWARTETRVSPSTIAGDSPLATSQPRNCQRPGDVRHGDDMSCSVGTPLPPSSDVYNDPSLENRIRSAIVTRSSDALEVLFEAAQETAQGHLPQVGRDSPPLSGTGSAQLGAGPSGINLPGAATPPLSYPEEDILDFWDKCRFVRQGWFTAQEAVTYLDL